MLSCLEDWTRTICQRFRLPHRYSSSRTCLSAATAGLAILGAQYWGKQDIKALDDIFALAIRICGIVSVLFFVACAFFPRYLMLIFTNEPVLIDYGVSYLKIAFPYLLTGFSQCYIVMMKISEHAGTAAAVSSITVLINIMLNAIFIYGAFGIESMNVRGAALATLISWYWSLCFQSLRTDQDISGLKLESFW